MMKQKFNIKWLAPMVTIFIVILIVLILLFLMRGNTVTRGENPDNEKSEALICAAENTTYSFLKEDGENIKIKINAIFVKNEISSISLTTSKIYDGELLANQALARMMANMNKSFSAELGAGAFNAAYSTNASTAQMNLYADASILKTDALEYFMINDSLRTVEQYRANYESQNFSCKHNN